MFAELKQNFLLLPLVDPELVCLSLM